VADTFLKALTPAAGEATDPAMRQLEEAHDAALEQWRLAVERARYEAKRAEIQYRAAEPENRLVARWLEAEWEKRLRDLTATKAELERRERPPCATRNRNWPRTGSVPPPPPWPHLRTLLLFRPASRSLSYFRASRLALHSACAGPQWPLLTSGDSSQRFRRR